jgi:enamine deaminase RidA (YjgF/YER057c/UK114 family)
MRTVTHLNPPGLPSSPAFSQATVGVAGRTLYIGGQNGTDSDGRISGGIAEQTRQALRNVLTLLSAADAGPQHVTRLTVYLAADVDPREAYAATGEVWGPHPTAVTVLRVAGLARPEALVEIEATAALG